jgi:protease-4
MSDQEQPPPQDPWIVAGETPPEQQAAAAPPSPADQGKPAGADTKSPGRDWERDVLTRLVFSTLQEQRRARRWNIFFRALTFAVLFFILFTIYTPTNWEPVPTGRHTALVELDGEIGADKPANADDLITSLRAAFKDRDTAGVIIRADSPGGSPVQSAYVNDEIFRLRKRYPKIPVYAVITDICASGCYYVVSAADKIYANKASIVGSIGVLMDGFGFVDTMKKVGVERRLITSGKNKGFLDPFSPLKEQDVSHIQTILDEVHQQFIDVVKKGRGDRLHITDDLFSGLMWTGEQSVKLGLVDELRSPGEVARDVIGAEKVVDYTHRPDYLQRFAERLGVAMGKRIGSLLGLAPHYSFESRVPSLE